MADETQYFEHLLKHGREVYALVGLDGVIRYKSPSVYPVFGYKPEELVGKTIEAVSHPEDKKHLVEVMRKTLDRPGEPIRFEMRYLHKNKGYRHVEGYVTNMCDIPEMGGIVVNYYDITDRTSMYKALNESREHLDLALRGADLGIWDWDLKTGKIFYNRRWAQMLGYSLEEIDQEEGFWENLLHPDDAEIVQQALQDHVDGKTSFYETEHRLRTKANAWKWVLDRGRVIDWDNDGKPSRAAGTHQDIDKRKTAELELRNTTEALARINQELEHFAYLTSHNLRAPVVNLVALLGHIDKSTITHPVTKDILEKVERVTDQLHSTLEDLLQLVSLKDEAKPQLRKIRFENILKGITTQLQVDLDDVDASITYDFEEVPSIIYPRNHLESIFLNLISNAIKYRSDKRRLEINVTSASENEYTVLFFKDNGSGLDLRKYGSRIFEIHQRFHKRDTGKGLGLFIVKKQLNALEGSIEVQSMPDKGTTFKVKLLNQEGRAE